MSSYDHTWIATEELIEVAVSAAPGTAGARITLVDTTMPEPDRDALGPAARGLYQRRERWPTEIVWRDDATGGVEILLGVQGMSSLEVREAAMSVPPLLARVGPKQDLQVDLVGVDAADGVAAALVEGLVLGSYQPPAPLSSGYGAQSSIGLWIRVAEQIRERTMAACSMAAVRGRVAALARTLTDLPPSSFTPAHFAETAGVLALDCGWRDSTLSRRELVEGGFGGILSVGNGSAREPCLIDVSYQGQPGEDTDVVIVGKGVTMDCGGMNLKVNRQHVLAMKADMASGASAIAALWGVSRLGLPINVRVLVPAVENMPGPGATIPGDVVRHRGGITTEVTNTDAEGRMLLADGLAYASEQSSGATILTIGTLMELAIGPAMWPVVTSDESLAADLRRAGAAVGEEVLWVPPPRHYDHYVRSRVADLQNFAYPAGRFDLLMATTFLSRFAGARRWAHLDVCETAYLEQPWGSWPVGATGSPSRTLLQFLVHAAADLGARRRRAVGSIP